MMKKIVLIIIIIWFLSGVSYSYFEDKYYCKTDSKEIWVSLKKSDWYIKCLETFADINNKLRSLDTNISSAQRYIDKNQDKEYWIVLKNELLKQQEKTLIYKDNLIKYINNFEWLLFVKIKKLLEYYLKKDLDIIDKEYNIIVENIQISLSLWNENEFNEYKKKLEFVVMKKALIDSTLKAESFDQMIPYLRVYMNNYYNN